MVRLSSRACARPASLAAFAVLVVSCAGAPAREQVRARPASRPRIPEDVLQRNGLETVWYFPSEGKDNPVQMAELTPEGLFVATAPGDTRGRLTLLKRASGSVDWTFPLEHALRSPPSVYRYPSGVVGAEDEVYFAQLDKVHCLSLKYGHELWSADMPHSVSTRVVADELNFFFGSDNGRVYGMRKKTGVELWQYRTGGSVSASPLVHAGNVFFASTDGALYRLFATAPGWIVGSSWRFETGARITGSPTVFSRWVLVGSHDYSVYCLEIADGTRYWSCLAEAPIEGSPCAFSVGSGKEYVFFVAVERYQRTVRRTLFCVRLQDGREVWRLEGVGKVLSLGKKNLYVLTDAPRAEDRAIAAIDVEKGQELFRIPAPGFEFIPFNSADSGRDAAERGRIYLVSRDWTIQAIGEKG